MEKTKLHAGITDGGIFYTLYRLQGGFHSLEWWADGAPEPEDTWFDTYGEALVVFNAVCVLKVA